MLFLIAAGMVPWSPATRGSLPKIKLGLESSFKVRFTKVCIMKNWFNISKQIVLLCIQLANFALGLHSLAKVIFRVNTGQTQSRSGSQIYLISDK